MATRWGPALLTALLITVVNGKLVPFTAHGQDPLGVLTVDIEPYPAYPGENVTIRVAAVPTVDLLPGSSVRMVVKQVGIPIPTRTYDVCQCSSRRGERGIWANTPTVLRFDYPVPGFAFKGTASARVTTTDHQGNVVSFLTLTIEVGSKRPKTAVGSRADEEEAEARRSRRAVPVSTSCHGVPPSPQSSSLPPLFGLSSMGRLAPSPSFKGLWQAPSLRLWRWNWS